MKAETKEIYKCDFCSRWYQLKRFAESHEKSCTRNPDNYRKCLDGCKNLEKRKAYHVDVNYIDEELDGYSLLYCKAREVFLYPPKVEHRKSWIELDGEKNEPMVKECSLYDGLYHISAWLDFLSTQT